MFISGMYKNESAIVIHMSSPFWTSLPPLTPLGCHRALDLSFLYHIANFLWLSNLSYFWVLSWIDSQRVCLIYCCRSVNKSYPALCNPRDFSMPGSSVRHWLPEFAQIHVQWVSDAISKSVIAPGDAISSSALYTYWLCGLSSASLVCRSFWHFLHFFPLSLLVSTLPNCVLLVQVPQIASMHEICVITDWFGYCWGKRSDNCHEIPLMWHSWAYRALGTEVCTFTLYFSPCTNL